LAPFSKYRRKANFLITGNDLAQKRENRVKLNHRVVSLGAGVCLEHPASLCTSMYLQQHDERDSDCYTSLEGDTAPVTLDFFSLLFSLAKHAKPATHADNSQLYHEGGGRVRKCHKAGGSAEGVP
jgi:hypothetical protein